MILLSGTEETQVEVQIAACVSLRSSGMCKHLNTPENVSLRNQSAELMSVGLQRFTDVENLGQEKRRVAR